MPTISPCRSMRARAPSFPARQASASAARILVRPKGVSRKPAPSAAAAWRLRAASLTWALRQPTWPHSHRASSPPTLRWPKVGPSVLAPRCTSVSIHSPTLAVWSRVTTAKSSSRCAWPNQLSASASRLAGFSSFTGSPVRSPSSAPIGTSRSPKTELE